jgi:RNA polymerase sigma-70 factor (ECF subfamily)
MLEAEIISQCQRSDRKAQRQIYEAYYSPMFSLCMRYSKNAEQAKDMLNKGFRFVFDKISTYNSKLNIPFSDWIKQQFVHQAVAYLKSNRLEYFVTTTVRVDDKRLSNDLFHQADDDDPNHASEKEILRAIQQLPASFRVAFNLNVVEGYSEAESSEILEVSEYSGKVNLEKARYQLAQNIRLLQKGYK